MYKKFNEIYLTRMSHTETHRFNYPPFVLCSGGFCTLSTVSTRTFIRSAFRPLNRSRFRLSLGFSTLLQCVICFFFDLGGFDVLLDFCPQHLDLYTFPAFLFDGSDGSVGHRECPSLNLSPYRGKVLPR